MSKITYEQREGMRRLLLQVIGRYIKDVRAQRDNQLRDFGYGIALGNISAGSTLGLFDPDESWRLYTLALNALICSREDARHA